MSEHAKYGGSTIKRTFECPAWVSFCAPIPNPSSQYADRGTLLHNAMERIYTEDEDFDARSVIGSEYEGIPLTAELYDEKIVPAIDAVEAIFERYNVEDFACEARVTIAPNVWGTSDFLAMGETTVYDPDEDPSVPGAGESCKVGICLDYKFGDGVIVKAFENDQGLFYAVAAAMTPEVAEFFHEIDILVIGIIQPNERGEDDFTLWEVEPAILDEMRGEIMEAVRAAEKENPAFNSGDHCNFCPGRGICPGTSGEVSAMLRLDVAAPDLLENIPTFAELAQAEATIKAIRSLVHSQIEEGVEIAGFKLVSKRATRQYTDEPAVREIVKRSRKIKAEEGYKTILLTPAQMEKMCKGKELDFNDLFGSLVEKVSSGTTLADASDPREATPGLGALQALLNRD